MTKDSLALCLFISLTLSACGGDGTTPADAARSCSTHADCGAQAVCLVSPSGSACAPTCTGAAGECSGSATCGGVGVLSVSACQEPQSTSANDPPTAEEQPRVPCASDDECKTLDPRGICAQFQGHKDCTIACTAETACDTPSVGGVKTDFLTCLPDGANAARSACLPDERCFSNPLACVTFGI